MRNKWIYVAGSSILSICWVYHSFPLPLFFILILYLIMIMVRSNRYAGVWCCIAILLYALHFVIIESGNQSQYSKESKDITGKIITTPKVNGDMLTFTLQTKQNEAFYVSYRVGSEHEKKSLSTLTSRLICSFPGKLNEPEGARNFHAFDFKQYLYFNKIHWIVTPQIFSLSHCTDQYFNILDEIYVFREKGLKMIEDSFPPPFKGYAQALTFGSREELGVQTEEAFQQLGLIHLLAISGMHIGLLCAFIYYCGLRIGVTREKVIVILMILLPIYAILAGFAPSVVRAAIMCFLALLKLRFPSITLTTLDLISLAFLLMITVNPYYLFNVGFQLSFSVSLALILSSQYIFSRTKGFISQLAMVSIAATICSTPIILYHFYQFSVLSIPLNLFYVPMTSFFILPISFLSYFLQLLLPELNHLLIGPINECIQLLEDFVLTISKLDWQFIVLGRPSKWYLVLYSCSIFCLFVLLEKRGVSVKNVVLAIVPFTMITFIDWSTPYLNPYGEVTMMDVGQGDSLLIVYPYQKEVYLVDTGGTVSYGNKEKWQEKSEPFSIGKDIIVSYLKSKGINKISKLILTHPDFDHIGESLTLLEYMKIYEVMIPDYHIPPPLEIDIINKAKKKGSKITVLSETDEWMVGTSQIRILNPSRSFTNVNDGSIVMMMKLGSYVWLLTGDIEKAAEDWIVNQYPNLKIDVLKIAHHGSKTSTSSAFLAHTNPNIALISSGKNNRYGHPSKEVITRLNDQNVTIFRTDQNGAIRYRFLEHRGGTFEVKIPYDKVRKHNKN
ncbi:DNA internalization-related competence protein ComEC/Rec2 [Bacillus salitolerans]|uniref:DNA internalization-related competence protein ComEC/Rec2 n=1 Tax=Bacillus salitolerans TaxID=1437434 RepID=A0ABW4LNG8_9BACI